MGTKISAENSVFEQKIARNQRILLVLVFIDQIIKTRMCIAD